MKKNGFVFIETIIVIVVLTSSLLLLYSTFTKILQSEKTRVYYDDMAYIYRTWHIKNQINELNLLAVTKELNENSDKYFVTIGMEYEDLFLNRDSDKTLLDNMINDYDVNQMIILKENKLDNIKDCKESSSNCSDLYTNLSDDMINYLRTIYVDVPSYYILAIEYISCDNDDTNCKKFYSWVSV